MSVFKAYDVRGVYGTQIDEKLGAAIGRAFVGITGARSLVVGRDMRKSAPGMAAALIEGARSAGANVIDIGLSSTPMTYFAIGSLGVDGGVQVTASHNPPQYIGFKFCRKGCVPVSGDTGIKEMEELIQTGKLPSATRAGTEEKRDVRADYLAHVLQFATDIKPLRVVIDTANGMGGHMIHAILEKLPVKATVLFPELDGSFPNHEADPLKPKNTAALSEAVRKERADLGIAFDGDADRCVFLDHEGKPLRSDFVTAAFAENFLAKEPGAAVVYDLRSSRATREAILQAKGRPIRDRVGHSFIKATMRKERAVMGGELSGHYYFRDNFVSDSGELAMLVMLSILGRKGGSAQALLRPFDRYFSTGEINFHADDPAGVLAALKRRYANGQVDELDGVTVQYPDWWFNVRKSNTEPLVRLNLEADSSALCDEKREEVAALLGRAEE